MNIKKIFIGTFLTCSFIPCISAKTVEYKTTTVDSSLNTTISTVSPISEEKTVALSDVDRVNENLNTAIIKYEEEKARLEQEELERKQQEEAEAKAAAEKAAKIKRQSQITQAMYSTSGEEYSGDIYSLAQSYVGRGGDCFVIASSFINDYFGSGTTSNGSYQVSDPQPGDLIYYANGGLGTTHYAVYLGNGQALQGNFNGTTIIGSVYLNNASSPVFYRYN